MICAIVGSTVLTAASINTKATVTYKENRQAEYTVSSAAATIGDFFQKDVQIVWDWTTVEDGNPPVFDSSSKTPNTTLKTFWSDFGSAIWTKHFSGEEYEHSKVVLIEVPLRDVPNTMDDVYAQLSIDQDFNIYIKLSLDNTMDELSPYNETVYIQSIPTFDAEGKIVKLQWETPVIIKTSSS